MRLLYARFQPIGHLAQHVVACDVTEQIVHKLEAIKVDVCQKRRFALRQLSHCPLETGVEPSAIQK